jgi:hypothetical protein
LSIFHLLDLGSRTRNSPAWETSIKQRDARQV